ncbi:OmpA family protein [Sanyastnella coralliicola]|uniref:OmpA family protein n=1 Tax=Sanyastnella coralliicola TaxID=3069118 RepID=UPI0027B99181|nr:OmpA family protein [Longitalea sp. SCSIO 12813]
MKHITLLVACLLTVCTFASSTTHHLAVLFETASHELTPEAHRALNEFLADFSPGENLSLVISGHTDSRGSVDYNEALAERRTQVVKSYLLSLGYHPKSVVSYSFGEAEPQFSNTTEDGMAANRRVDLQLTRHFFESEAELLDQLREQNQVTVQIDPTEDHLIKSDRGSVIAIPAMSFVNASGDLVDQEIEFTIVEALDPFDFVASKLSTVSDDQLIETGGMMKLSASLNGEELELTEGASLTVALPTDQLQPGMQLFVSNDGGNWQATGQQPLGVEELVFPPFPQPYTNGYKEPKRNFDLPDQPRKPVSPIYPREPKYPNLQAYDVEFKWYEVFGRGKKIMRAEEARQAKIDLYDKAVERCEKRKLRYQEDMRTLPARVAQYAKDSVAYFTALDSAERHFQEVIIPEEKARWKKLMAQFNGQYEEELEAWRSTCDSIRTNRALELEAAGQLGMNPLNQYVYSVGHMGWINCDRFLGTPEEEKEDVLVKVDLEGQGRVVLAFTEIQSMMNMTQADKGYVARRIPKDANAVIFSYYLDDEGDIMLGHTPLNGKATQKVKFKEVNLAELREFLNELRQTDYQASL